jgi:hypothetical protein
MVSVSLEPGSCGRATWILCDRAGAATTIGMVNQTTNALVLYVLMQSTKHQGLICNKPVSTWPS